MTENKYFDPQTYENLPNFDNNMNTYTLGIFKHDKLPVHERGTIWQNCGSNKQRNVRYWVHKKHHNIKKHVYEKNGKYVIIIKNIPENLLKESDISENISNDLSDPLGDKSFCDFSFENEKIISVNIVFTKNHETSKKSLNEIRKILQEYFELIPQKN